MPGSEGVTIKLAQRGSLIGNDKDALWVKEVRKLTEEGHQVSVISTAYGLYDPGRGIARGDALDHRARR